jgi:predicted RNA-binding Zn ribbon-like protein
MALAVDLHPGPYHGTYKLIGGAPALDFANLMSYRGTDRQHDWLDPATNMGRWAKAAGVDARVPTEVRPLREFRELLARVFLRIAQGHTPAAQDVEEIGDVAAAAWGQRRLRLPPGAPAATWTDRAPSLLTEIALDAASLLTSKEALRRIAMCQECQWLFLDTTRNHSRRWCDPADCGNRARQRRHYRRHSPQRPRRGPKLQTRR